MGYFFTHSSGEEMIMEYCYSCGMKFAYSKAYYNILQREHKNFYCPRGHSQYYSDKTKVEKLTEQVERLEQRCHIKTNQIEHLERRFNGLLGYAAKLKKKVKR